MSTQNMGRVGADRLAEAGISLVELLVGLVVTSLLAIAVFSFFLNTSQGISQQNASGEMWQRGRNALALMRQAIESAGYGLPSYSQCPNGVVG
ncbi:pilus assembly protein PilW, partial [Acidithiobacillus caldus]|nr:pilus assembly protein PilW [Acidithiobacillus caldus]